MRWKCHNCMNIFETEGEAYEEFLEHCEACFNLEDFFEIIHHKKELLQYSKINEVENNGK